MAGVPKNAVAVTPGGAVKESQIAGYVTMFTIPDDAVSGNKLLRTWALLDLDTELLPPARRPVNVFQAACRSVEVNRRRSTDAMEVKVDEIMETDALCVYQVTRLVRDKTDQVIDHPKAMRVTFTKEDESIKVDPHEAEHYHALAGLEDAIRDYYNKNATKVPGYKVRSVLRAYMGVLGATNLRRKAGGVYFVPARGKETLEGITEALDTLYGERADLHTIPLVNDEGAREMVRKHFAINAIGQIDELMAKIAEALHGTRERRIRSDFVGNVAQQRHAITALKDEYSGLLESELSEIGSKIADLDEQMDALSEAVADEEAVAA